jgi:hypothetical protein
MNHREFTFWLQGFMDGVGDRVLASADREAINKQMAKIAPEPQYKPNQIGYREGFERKFGEGGATGIPGLVRA